MEAKPDYCKGKGKKKMQIVEDNLAGRGACADLKDFAQDGSA